MALPGASVQGFDSEIVKGGDGVGLGPQADPAGVADGVIRGFEELPSVEVAGDAIVGHGYADRIPACGL